MADSVSENQNPKTEEDKNQENDNNTVEEEDDDVIDDDIEEEEGEEDKLSKIVRKITERNKLVTERNKLVNLMNRLSKEKVNLRVHDIIIKGKGNKKTKDPLLESEVESLKTAMTMQELLQAAALVNSRLRNLDIFHSVNITLDSGPLPGTANVTIEVEEKNIFSYFLGYLFSKPEARSYPLEFTINLKNIFGNGDIWDSTWAYRCDQASDISAGAYLLRFKGLSYPLTARISLQSQDWLNISSNKKRMLGLSVGLLSTRHHDLAYNLTWRNLTDPSQMSSRSVRKQLGHSLLSSLKYKFTVDRRDSPLRPTRGYAFVSSTQVGGLSPDSRSLRFLRQEFDLGCAFPRGFYISGRAMIDLSGSSANCTGRDVLGGDLACSAFADLSFNLPSKVLRDAGVRGHLFASTGNLTKLTENKFQNFSFRKFGETFRSSIGAGIIVPTKLFRMEINYCYLRKQFEHYRGKTGIQFSFSSPL